MTKPKKYTYQLQYEDNTYRIVDWTKEEFSRAANLMANGDKIVIMEDGVYRLHDVRAIVLLPEPEPEETEEDGTPKQPTQFSEWGFTDPEVQEWLLQNGIDVKNGGMLE